MTFADFAAFPAPGLRVRLISLRERMQQARERRRYYESAMRELRQLDDREMMELGLSPSQFHEIALQDAARRMAVAG